MDSSISIRYNHSYYLSLPLAINVLSNALYAMSSNTTSTAQMVSSVDHSVLNNFEFEVSHFRAYVAYAISIEVLDRI